MSKYNNSNNSKRINILYSTDTSQYVYYNIHRYFTNTNRLFKIKYLLYNMLKVLDILIKANNTFYNFVDV